MTNDSRSRHSWCVRSMDKITPNEVDTFLRKYLRSRSDLGLWKAVQAAVIEPRNPFESRPARTPQRWFVLLLIVLAILMGAFLYFNLRNDYESESSLHRTLLLLRL
jgi:hypothetical protein